MILVTGANGQLGSDVCACLRAQERAHLGVDADVLDITDDAAVAAFFMQHPDIDSVIHCAAYTAVDKAEDEPERCYNVNVHGTENLAKAAGARKFLYISTEYVFGAYGTEEMETNDVKHPQNVYAKSKLLGEIAVQNLCPNHFIVRTSWVFGEKNTNFIATMLRLSFMREKVAVVCDQVGSPTYAKDLAALLCEMISTERYGLYHATNEGACSWDTLARTVFSYCKLPTEVVSITSEDYNAKAKRPKNSRLSKRSLDENGFARLRPWKNAVYAYLKNVKGTLW